MGTEALERAVVKAGGQSALAAHLRKTTGKPVRQGHVWAWLNRTRKVPPEYVIPIEAHTGISRHQLRPDIYPKDSAN